MKAFKNPLDPENIDTKKAIRQGVIARFKLDDSVVIGIVEHGCTEASCVYAETVISLENGVFTEGGRNPDSFGKGRRFFKITKPLVYIRKIDIALMEETAVKPTVHRH